MKNQRKTDEKVPLLSAIAKGAVTKKLLGKVIKKSPATVTRKLKIMEQQGLVQKVGYPHILELTARGRVLLTRKKPEFIHKFSHFSLGMRKKTRAHRMVFKIPITKDNPENNIKWDKVNKGFKNTEIKYVKILHPEIGITLAKVGSSSVLIYLHEKEFNRGLFTSDFTQYAFRAVYLCKHFLWQKGIYIDELEVEVTQQHLANPEPEFDKNVDKKLTLEVGLGRDASSIFPMKEKGKAWIDRSKGLLEVETNDMVYAEKLALMPEKLFEIGNKQEIFASNLEGYNKSLEVYSKNIKLHMEVMQDMRDTLKKIRREL